MAELKTLASIIQSSIEQIETVVTTHSLHFPSPESPFNLESEAPRMHPAIQSAGLIITSAAAQLMTLVRPAPLALLDIVKQVRLKIVTDYGSLLKTGNDLVPCLYGNSHSGEHPCC